jgi:hypothetical protein
MRLPNIEWLWLIVFVVAWLWPVIRKVRSAGERDKPPPAPKAKPKRRPQTRREPVSQDQRFGGRKAVVDQIRVLVDQIRRGAQPPAPGPGAPAPIREAASAPEPAPAPAVPPPIRETVSGAPPASKLPPPSPSRIPEPEPTPASIWAEALRDRQNLRRIIIAAEIIGPPKGA